MFAFHISYQWFSLYTSSLYTPLSLFGSCSLHKGSIIISRFSIRASLQTCLFYFQSLFQGISTRWGFLEPLPPEKGHGGAFRTVPWERYPHPREKTVEVTFHTCVYKKKPPELLQVRRLQSKRRLPTLPLWRSTIGVTRLNFSVRNGKRWNPCAIATWIRLTYCWAVIVISFCSKNQRYTPSDI